VALHDAEQIPDEVAVALDDKTEAVIREWYDVIKSRMEQR
jgi:hypothetical protein